MKSSSLRKAILLLGWLFCVLAPAQTQNRVEEMLREHRRELNAAAAQFGVSPRLLASIVVAEQSMNVKPGEPTLDYVFARSGYNSSLGLAQIKVATAEWIEHQLGDSNSRFYLGGSLRATIPPAQSAAERIDRLTVPAMNLLYAAAYVAMIEKLWSQELHAPAIASSKTAIIATVYSLGVLNSRREVRAPHANPQANDFG
ncbi:MAG: hypothetical protein HYY49_01405, partial [Ignavibacteriales bacterium]|nr:hypothetical protein [Ignavibacteriales bacterium]